MRNGARKTQGTSLAKGPAWLIGLALLALGVTGFIFGSTSLTADPVDGDVTGGTWLSIAGNGWTWALFAAAGLLLMLGAPVHWGAKAMALIVGLALGAASVIALVDGTDVLGVFAANGMTKLVWGVAAAALLVIALLPRVGKKDEAETPARERVATRESARGNRHDREATVEAERTPARSGRFDRDAGRSGEAGHTGAVPAGGEHDRTRR